MRLSNRSIARLAVPSLLGALTSLAATTASAAPSCDPATLTCSVGTAPLKAQIKDRLPTTIDSGMMDKGLIKVRTRFTIDPVGRDPLLAIDMPTGALVEASWSEKGFVNVHTLSEQGAQGTIKSHYTLVPSIEASIYGIGVNYNATDLVNRIPGAAFNSDMKSTMQFQPWGFQGATLTGTPPALDQATIFGLQFSSFGVPSGIVTGTLSIQAAPNPTFTFATKNVILDAASITKADGIAKLPVGDDDFLDLTAAVSGDVTLGGTIDIRPVVKVDTVDGFPTFGLVKYGFTAVSAPIGGAAIPVKFDNTTIHIPLPNVKVPTANVNLGDVKPGGNASKSVTIDSTGEMGGKLKFESSNPQFVVPSGEVPVAAKSKYDLQITFNPSGDAAASATITVRSNDPGSPEQTFKIGANGADLGSEDSKDGAEGGDAVASDGCTFVAGSTSGRGTGGYLGLALGLGLAIASRRRRSR